MRASGSSPSGDPGNRNLRGLWVVFHDETSLVDAVDDLRVGGFDRPAIRPLAGRRTVARTLGHDLSRVAEFEVALGGVLACLGAVTAIGFVPGRGDQFMAARRIFAIAAFVNDCAVPSHGRHAV